jgi:hypothetical protein
MIRPSALARAAKRSVWLAGVAALAAAGLVSAQPAPGAPPAPKSPSSPKAPPAPKSAAAAPKPAAEAAPGAPGGPPGPVGAPSAPEEAPPQEVPAPAPVVVPPISEKDIQPAPAPPALEQKPAVPVRRARYDVAILEALDKITAKSLVFEAPVGKPVRYKGLIFTVRACERSTPEEPVQDSIAYLTIDSEPRAEAGRPTPPARQVFKGWMYAASPGLNPLQHPVYDAWVISCRAATPSAVASR